MAAVVGTERMAEGGGARPPRGRGAARSGPDRGSVLLFSLAAFLVVLTLMANQLRASAAPAPQKRVVVVRRIYRTTIIETIVGSGRGTSVSQSMSSSGSSLAYSPPTTTRSSPAH
jgi:hypothetical protein